VLPLFVLMVVVITGAVAIVTDVSWFWVNQQRMQRAADAAALAGAVFLPGDMPGAYSAVRDVARQNGFIDGQNGVTITAGPDPLNVRRLDVNISGPVGTFFAGIFGMTSATAGVTAKAEFARPVPMGSPLSYYGVYAMRSAANPDVGTPIISSDGVTVLPSQGFWGSMLSEGSDKVNGDGYMSAYDPRTSGANADYAPDKYYDYAIEMPAGSSNGSVWIFDAPFCGTDPSARYGTGDRWLSGNAPVSAFYELWDTRNTPWDATSSVASAQATHRWAARRWPGASWNAPPA